MKDGDVDPRREGNFGGPLRKERGLSRHARANKVHDRTRNLGLGGQGNPNSRVASQVAAATCATWIATGESSTVAVRSAATALALMEAARDHVETAHA